MSDRLWLCLMLAAAGSVLTVPARAAGGGDAVPDLAPTANKSPASAPLQTTPCDFGVAYPWTTVSCETSVTNASDHPITLQDVAAGDKGLSVDGLPIVLAPGKASSVRLKLDVDGRLGKRNAGASITLANAGKNAEHESAGKATGAAKPAYLILRAQGFVYSVLEQPQSKLDLGAVEAGSGASKALELSSRDVADFRVTKVLKVPEFVHASIAPDEHHIKLTLADDAPWGLLSGELRVALNTPQEPEARIPVTANVLGRVRPGENPYALGLLRTNNDNEVSIQLTSTDGKDFRIGKISKDRIEGKTDIEPCAPAKNGCKLLKLVISKDQPTGNLGSQIHIALPDEHKTLTVGLWGLLVTPETKIHDLNKEIKDKEKHADDSQQTGADFSQSLEKVMKEDTPPPADPPGQGPVLRWKVANQQPLYGYLIYRAASKDGPFMRVNKQIVPVESDDGPASSYAWRDTSATPGKTYWYYISTLSNNGSKQQLSGAQKVVAHK